MRPVCNQAPSDRERGSKRAAFLANAKKGLPFALAAVAMAMFCYRWLHLELAAFIQDEPAFLSAAHDQLQSGRWLTESPITGTQGIAYGPSVVWLYSAIQWVFGADPVGCIRAICLLVTASQALLAFSVSRAFRGGAWMFALLAALIASSPYQYFWSRLAWDPLANVCSAGAVALLCWPGPARFGRLAAMGLLLGVGISSHPMILPLVGLIFATILLREFRNPSRGLALCGAAFVPLIVFNAPYFWALHEGVPARIREASFELTALLEHLAQPIRVATDYGMEYFFDADWFRFQQEAPLAAALHQLALPFEVLLFMLTAAGLLLSAVAGKGGPRATLARLALATWWVYPVFYALRALPRHPHYQFPTWWIVPVGVASLISLAGQRSRPLGIGIGIGVGAMAVLQFAFIPLWMDWIGVRAGTRGVHYGTVVGAQMDVVDEVCRRSEPNLAIEDRTAVFPRAFDYLAKTRPACAGKHVVVCRFRCPPLPGPLRRVDVSYFGNSAALTAQ